jgi:hypothetical protein
MSRYRKIEVKLWGDEKFRRLSGLQPSGQALWLFLLTGPHTGVIPGLFRAGQAGMAEELNWDIKAFREAFREAFKEGMVKADFEAKLVYLPNAIKHNKPESPNVIRAWGKEAELLPECPLKVEAIEDMRAYVTGLGEAWDKAFVEAFGKPSGKPSPKAMANQEQEQEQEQEVKEKILKKKKPTELELLSEFEIDGDLANDFIKHRKAKYAPITKTALSGFKRESELARMPIQEAVRICIERNWQGFKAEWLSKNPQNPQPGGKHESSASNFKPSKVAHAQSIGDHINARFKTEVESELGSGAV